MYSSTAPTLFALATATASALGQTPQLVLDIEDALNTFPVSVDSNVNAIWEYEETLLLGAQDGTTWPGIWRYDPSTGTALQLSNKGLPESLQTLPNGLAVYSCGIHERDLWSTDGTPHGTIPIHTYESSIATDSVIAGPVLWEDVAWFVGKRIGHGYELFSTDGTEDGSVLYHEFVPGPEGLDAASLAVAGGKLFASVVVDSQASLYSFAPSGGPVYLGNLNGGSADSPVQEAMEFAGELWLSAGQGLDGPELWKSDGTVAGTILVADLQPGSFGSNPKLLGATSQRLWLSASTQALGRELYAVESALTGAQLISDLNPGSGSGFLGDQAGVLPNGTLVFSGSDGLTEEELFISDGTPLGTVLLADLSSGSEGSSPQEFQTFQSSVYFSASTPNQGRELWSTDGTVLQTVPVYDFSLGAKSGDPVPMVALDTLYIAARDNLLGRELWSSLGTASTTQLAANLAPELVSDDAAVESLWRIGDRIVFPATNSVYGKELWSSDGTTEGTFLLKDFWPGSPSGNPFLGVELKGKLLVRARVSASQAELWLTDGTAEGTVHVFSFPEGLSLGNFDWGCARLGDEALFPVSTIHGTYRIFKTDGTAAGTVGVTPAPKNVQADFHESVEFDGKLFFAGSTPESSIEPWVTDGTNLGTFLLADLWPDWFSNPENFTPFQGSVYFTATGAEAGREVYVTDGTSAGTKVLKDLNPGFAPSGASDLIVLHDSLLFSASDGIHGKELWTSDGTPGGTVLLKDIASDPMEASSSPSGLTKIGDRVYFRTSSSTNSPTNPVGLHSTDGTSQGTQALEATSGFNAAPYFSGGFAAFGGSEKVLSYGFTPNSGTEMWVWDEDNGTTTLLPEVYPGPGSSVPHTSSASGAAVVELGGRLLFAACDPIRGRELFALDLIELGVPGTEPFGIGCSGSVTPQSSSAGLAAPGETFEMAVEGAMPLASALLFLGLELSPLDLGASCTSYLKAPTLLATSQADPEGNASFAVQLADNPALTGLQFFVQWVTLEAGGPLLGNYAMSDCLDVVVGA